jgi:SAM-dependent methyltransferase
MKTCWHDHSTTPSQMIAGAKGQLWPKLSESGHAATLIKFIKLANKTSILDLGCGAAELNTILPEEYAYCGADLPHIIDLVARKLHPDLHYIKCDIEQDDINFLSNYDLIVMNAFIDVLDRPLQVLDKILCNATGSVLLHRQEIGNRTMIEVNDSYGGKTFKSILSRSELDDVIGKYGYKIKAEHNMSNQFSFLLDLYHDPR